VLEQDGERMLRVFDPGSAKLRDAADTLRDLSLTDSAGEGEAQADGMLMSWDEVCTRFETLNLNWDPALLPVTVERHWSWPKPADSGADNRSSPRYRITACAPSSTPGADLWLLLSQHQTSKASPLDDVALHVFRDYAGKWCQAQVQHATVRIYH
jgi:hypothetical protein